MINNDTTIDAVDGLRKGMRVVIIDDQIVEVGTDPSAMLPKDAVLIDGTDKFLIPGLWDAHVHLTFTPGLEDSMFRLFIANGVTSVRDTGGQLEQVVA